MYLQVRFLLEGVGAGALYPVRAVSDCMGRGLENHRKGEENIMLKFLNFLKKEANMTYTENGAVTLRSTSSECLDLFAVIGALRSADENDICERFMRAYAEDPDLAMKILFYARDIRGGLGERQVFRTLIAWLAENEKASLVRNLKFVAEYGRWDDMLALLDTPAEQEAVSVLREQFEADMKALESGEAVSLLGKWLPSVNASNKETVRQAKKLAKAFNMKEADYRKAVSALRIEISIIENKLREGDYSFDYSKQTSKAMFRYRKAFMRNDGERYRAFMNKVSLGEAVLHTGTLMPYEIVRKAYKANEKEREFLDVTWNALEDFTGDENALVVVDGSGSMYGHGNPLPAEVAQSLAIYFAERNRGAFRGHFITFSMTPQLVEIKGKDITEKVRYCRSFNECANTDLKAVFELILRTALKNRVSQKELPDTLYIISDMEFDGCAKNADITNFEYAKRLYRKYGYKLPRVVFWNVQSRNSQQPVKSNEQGVALVSGFTARIFSQVMSGEMDPYTNMMNVIGSERYEKIKAA